MMPMDTKWVIKLLINASQRMNEGLYVKGDTLSRIGGV